ncbi:hypothetical protein C3492_35680 [Streptomyces sp. Ru62]|uniref:DUF6919 domain-containing protein n=1 Tax=Streptomyces sp. Ru62 TaxID=2080745 RepID=UPI000CDE3175|nr:hypothetical protein [Streptomyces sp. Ru62]POX58874.1 hypothetical protein C3492_35680 [Streptomyces sp. Ru62]
MKVRLPLLERMLKRPLDRRWKTAETLADLGDLMALWLEGEITSWPGYAPGYGPDEETRELIPTLAAANRAGYVTIASQPGIHPEMGFDGLIRKQKAAVEGFVRDRNLLRDLVDAAYEAGIDVEVAGTLDTGERGIVVTLRDGKPHTAFGGYLNGAELRGMWPGIGSGALDDVFRSVRITLAAPEYGAAAGIRVWQVLESVISRVPAAGGTTSDPR